MLQYRRHATFAFLALAFYFGVFGQNTDLAQYQIGGRGWKFYDYVGGILSELRIFEIYVGQFLIILCLLYSVCHLVQVLRKSVFFDRLLENPTLIAVISLFIWPQFVGATNTLRQLFFLSVLYLFISLLIEGKSTLAFVTIILIAFCHKAGALFSPFLLIVFFIQIFNRKPFPRFLPILLLFFSFITVNSTSFLFVDLVSKTTATGLDLRPFLVILNLLPILHLITITRIDRSLGILYSVNLMIFGVALNFYSESLIFERLMWSTVLPSLFVSSILVKRFFHVRLMKLVLISGAVVSLYVHLPQNLYFEI